MAEERLMQRAVDLTRNICLAALPILGVAWIMSLPDYFGLAYTFQQMLGVVLGLTVAAALLRHPYGARAGLLDLSLAAVAFFCWFWMAWNFDAWVVGMADRTPDKWVPGLFAVLLMMEALRKSCGMAITILVWTAIAYAFFGDHMPGALEAEVFPPTKTILYLYADNNGIPGLVLRVVMEMVLAFVILGKIMEVGGATKFFTDLSLSLMGHRRGGPAKVAVIASSAFGSISGSTVGNIMSTGIVTIPLMKRCGFQPRYAAAIEAVSSNGGQITPPVMGATAFIIAEFLEISYTDVVIAAVVPAAMYYLVLFLQIDSISKRFGLVGLPKAELPKAWPIFARGWIFLVPLGVLIYFLFGLGYNAGKSALYASFLLFVLAIFMLRRLPSREEWRDYIIGGGEALLPLLLISAGAGVVIGVLNATGLAFQLSLILTSIGQANGVIVMLLLTALIAIVLGMGMPTAAVYIVLATVVAPAIVDMGVKPMAAHLFLFYFGLLSMLTPPVAVASMVAAGLAGADMWKTGLTGVQLALTAYLLPFLWVFNPAVLLDGSGTEIVLALASVVAAAVLLAQAGTFLGAPQRGEKALGLVLLAGALATGSSTVWLGPQNWLVLAPVILSAAASWGVWKIVSMEPAPQRQVAE